MNEILSFFAKFASPAPGTGQTAYLAIDVWQLALAALFVLIAGIFSVVYHLRLEKDLAIGTVRAFAQLFAVGYILNIVFHIPSVWLVMGMYTATAWFATSIAQRRVTRTGVSILLPSFLAMLSSCFLVTSLVSGAVIQAHPWWAPQYFIPVGGMVAGNAMNALSIALERFFSELRLRRGEVEALLCLGATPREASEDMFRTALRAGMLNPINAMMGVGLVTLPGMMTGQILAGVSPVQAIRYQLVIVLMMTAASALSSFAVLMLVRRRCFSSGQALTRIAAPLS